MHPIGALLLRHFTSFGVTPFVPNTTITLTEKKFNFKTGYYMM